MSRAVKWKIHSKCVRSNADVFGSLRNGVYMPVELHVALCMSCYDSTLAVGPIITELQEEMNQWNTRKKV